MLGSHNSFSYLTPTKWWMRLFTPWAKCQNKTIKEQYNAGVRYFDIRVAFKKDGSIRLVHNLAEYPSGKLFDGLKWLKNKPDAHLRIVLDMRKKPKGENATTQLLGWFYDFLDYAMKDSVATIDKAIVFWNWKHIIDNGVKVAEWHSSVCAKWYEYLCGTEYWAEVHNDNILSSEKEILKGNDSVLLIDYV